MKTRTNWLHIVLLLAVILSGVGRPASAALPEATGSLGPVPDTSGETPIADPSSSSSVMFIENVGQFAEGARFQVRGGMNTLWLADDALWITVLAPLPAEDQSTARESLALDALPNRYRDTEMIPHHGVNVRLSFVGANPKPRLEPFNRLETTISYFLGGDPEAWQPDVPVWGGVRYIDLYPGIDLEVTSEGGQLVQRVWARAGADHGQIQLRVEGVDTVDLDGAGNLRLRTAVDDTVLPLLTAVDTTPDTQPVLSSADPGVFDVAAPFAILSLSTQMPQAAPHNQDSPSLLMYSTFLGESDQDYGRGIAVDGAGSAFVTGETWSSDFPVTPGVFGTTNSGRGDAFVVKLNPTGSGLVYATFLGGSHWDGGGAISVDAAGNSYVTGFTWSSDFPATQGAFDSTLDGERDAFVAKLDPSGSSLAYVTLLGGSDGDNYSGIAVDAAGSAYVIGETYSSDFPVTAGAFDMTYNGGEYDAFVAKLDPSGSDLVYSTFLGGTYLEYGRGLVIDGAGNVYVTGQTYSSDFPVTAGAYDMTLGGDCDGFVAELDPTGSILTYASFLGGSSVEFANMIAIDVVGIAYITGDTWSSDFPVTQGAFDTTLDGARDAFLAKLNPDGSGLLYATFLGGSSAESAYGLAVDAAGSACVAGATWSSNFPVTQGAFDTTHNGDGDIFVAKLDPSGSDTVYATFLGGSDWDLIYDMVGDDNGNAYVTGATPSPDFPVTTGAYDTTHNGYHDAFVARLSMDGQPLGYSVSGRVQDTSGTGISGVAVSAGSAGSAVTDSTGSYAITGLITGTYTITPMLSGYTFDPPSLSVTVPPDATGQSFVALRATRPWTFIYYLDADNNLDASYRDIFNRLEAGANNPDVYLLALWDGSASGDSAYYEVQYDTDLSSLATYTQTVNYWPKGELDMGSATTVVSFTNWVRATYPASYYALILSDHGSGLGGGMVDDWSSTRLSVVDIGSVLSSVTQGGTDKIDILYMDACLMGMIEDSYQVCDYVDFYVASEDLQWTYSTAYTRYSTDTTAATTPQQLATLFSMGYADEIGSSERNYTISAADISKLGTLTTTVDTLAGLLRTGIHTSTLVAVSENVQRFDSNGDRTYDTDDEYVDLYHFAQLVSSNSTDTELQAAAQAVMSAVDSYIIDEHHQGGAGTDVPDSHGVSIFFPRDGFSRSFYTGLNLDFAEGTDWGTQLVHAANTNRDTIAWGPMLVQYIEAVFPDAVDDPDPPELMPRLQDTKWVYLPLVVRN